MDSELKKQIILDNFENPYNKGLTNNSEYVCINANNESCIDNLNLEIKMVDNVIIDIHFDGEACVISTSATSIMIKSFIGKTKEEALEIIDNYEKMIDEEEYNSDILEEAIVYNDIYKQPSRKKCALLPYKSIKEYLLSIN